MATICYLQCPNAWFCSDREIGEDCPYGCGEAVPEEKKLCQTCRHYMKKIDGIWVCPNKCDPPEQTFWFHKWEFKNGGM